MVSAEKTVRAMGGEGGAETVEKTPPPLNMLYFYLTEGCNLRCRHCWIEPPHQSEKRQYPALDPELFRHIVSQAKPLGLSGVKLTGGEPLMHPRIGEVLEIIRQEDVDLTVETNGVLCSTEMAQDLRRSNLRHISVSLDGADADTHEWVRGVKGCFDAAVSGIQNLVAAGIRPQIIMSLMRRNVGQIERLVLLAESLGASSVKFNIVQPTARGIEMYRAGETLSIENLMKLGDWVENHLSSSVGIRLYYSHPMAFRSLGRMYGRKGDGCGNCNITHILGVLADGSYALCGIGMTVQEMIFGHAGRDTLADVWKRTPILNEVRNGLPGRLGGICGDCLMKGVCRGYCLAQNFNNTRNLWAPFWYCEEARRLGIFPVSRQKEQVIQHGRGDSRAQSSVAPRPVCGSEEKNNDERAFQV